MSSTFTTIHQSFDGKDDDVIEVPASKVHCVKDHTKTKARTISVATSKKILDDSSSIGEDDVSPSRYVENEGTDIVEVNVNSHRSIHRSSHNSGMDSSVFRFKNVNFLVGKKSKERHLLTDVSGKIRWGRKLE